MLERVSQTPPQAGAEDAVPPDGSPAARRLSTTGALALASFGALLAFLDVTIVNVAFPSIQQSFPEASLPSLSWVLNAYNIVFAAFLVAFGRLADVFGRRRVFSGGIVVFTLASVWCAAAPSLPLLIAGRAVQAAGAAALVPASLALVIAAFPGERRAHAIGMWGATAALAAGLGPPIGGALVEAANWRLAFAINIPLGIVAFVLSSRVLVESRAPGRRTLPDLAGAGLLAVAVALLTVAIVRGGDWGWTSPAVLALFAASVAVGALFAARSRRHPVPVLDPKLLRLRSFGVANAVTVVAGMGFYAYLLDNILWLHYVWGWSLLVSGLAVAPGAIVAAVVAGILGRTADARGHRLVVVPGALVWAAAYVWYATQVGTHPAFLGEWLPGQVLSGAGAGAVLPVLGAAALAAVPGGRFATASAVISSTRQLGAVLGVALLVVIIGTPSPQTAATAFRHGWVFSAACFLAVAIGAVLLRPGRHAAVETEDPPRMPVLESRPDRASSPSSEPLEAWPLLARLPDAVRARILAGGEDVSLRAGEWLFHQDEAADSMYLIEAGRLEVVRNGAVVRELVAGDVVGELGVFAATPRAAGVRARRDSVLVRVSGELLTEALTGHETAYRDLTAALAERLQTIEVTERTPPRPRVVAVVGLDPHARAEEVGAALVDGLDRHLRVVAPGRVGPDGLARAELESDRVVLVAGADMDDDWQAFCLRQADVVVLAASSSEPPAPTAATESASGRPCYLVLTGEALPTERLLAWHDAVHPRRAYVAGADEGDVPSAVGPLADRLAGRSLGVAVAGGGARAFASIGVVGELLAAGYRVDRLAGCSLGGVVAALFATGRDAAAVDAVCYEEFVRRNPFNDYTLPRVALSRGHKAEAGLRRNLGDTHFEELPRELVLVSTDLYRRRLVVHRRGEVAPALRASLSLPGLYPPARVGDALLVDGGILANLPVQPLAERDEGPVVAVNIAAGSSSGSSRTGPPRMPTLPETLLRTMLMASAPSLQDAREQAAVVVTPDTRGIGLLEFHQMDRAVEAGRAAGRAVAGALAELLR